MIALIYMARTMAHMNWKPLFDYYEVSDTGLVRSIDRLVHGNKHSEYLKKGKIHRGRINDWGYHDVLLNRKLHRVHRLVAEHFIPNPENKPQVNHKNGIKMDNRVENLEWVTPSENCLHAVRNGLRRYDTGHKHPMAKLTSEQAEQIRKATGPRGLIKKLAKEFGVGRNTIRAIRKGLRYV